MKEIRKNYDSSLQKYESNWNEIQTEEYKNPTMTLYTSMVFGFAKHLPYSMDIEQPEYVPADFLNMIPLDVETNNWFKWEDRRTFFNAMISWGDSFKSGMILQLCNIFQKMILGEFPANYELKEEDYSKLRIDTMTKDETYNKCFFETLKLLPYYYQEVVSASNTEERRTALEKMYYDIINKISARYGSFKETDEQNNVIRETKGTISAKPSHDIEMLVYWESITYYDGIPSIIEEMKKEQSKNYHNNKPLSLEKKRNI